MKPLFLDAPGRWNTSPRTDFTPAEYANPVEHVERPMDWQDVAVIAASVVAALALAAILYWPA